MLRELTTSLCIIHNKEPETNFERIVTKCIQQHQERLLTQMRVTQYKIGAYMCNVTMLYRHQQLLTGQQHIFVSSEYAHMCRVKVCLCVLSECMPMCVE